MARILILDDEQPLLRSLALELGRAQHECLLAESGREALRLIERQSPDLAILDVQLPDMSGLDVLRRLRAELPEVPVLMITAYASVDSAVEAMKEGAIDYIEKPLDLEELNLVVERELQNSRLRQEVEAYRRDRAASAVEENDIVGESVALAEVRRMVDQISAIEVPSAGEFPAVLLLGETGVGKDLLARHIHRCGALARRPFVRINCAGLPRELVESELFGHEKGAFTGAAQRKQGLFEVAQGGTIFLDEIGDMPLDIQGKLLGVLETKQVRRVGGTREHHADVRVIAATNRDLDEMIAEGKFRSDLYYRLKVVCITLPPLRERNEDIPLLVEHFMRRMCRKYRKPGLVIPERVMERLKAWRWPGNIRELAHALEHIVLTSNGSISADAAVPGGGRASDSGRGENASSGASNRGTEGAAVAPSGVADPRELRFDFAQADCTLEAVERALVGDALRYTGGNVSEVARLLGVSRGALRHRLEKWDAHQPEARGSENGGGGDRSPEREDG